MGKGRKLTTSRSERFLGSFCYNQEQGTANGAAPELGEDEVWSLVDDTVNGDDHSVSGGWGSRASSEANGTFSSYSTRRPHPHTDHHQRRQVGGLSLAFDHSSNTSSPRIVHQFRAQDSVAESPRGRNMATSAPVNVPDWSKIYRVDSVESLHDSDDGWNEDSELVPPHEYLAREYARSRRIAANSVFEGVGRTLKGRDMSRVRDAVWSQTGFDG
ncbi:uncharacterized protein LOC105167985 [Sesamum indicum]|uniref:Uncharacterized protein LOC105167985 n=1 Tax=Sesamum indicum TaxID=4182 RepID=A0A6I9TK68_SESIN|nr:uncharacterized protein LOC105167985 [Sesamum indicum]